MSDDRSARLLDPWTEARFRALTRHAGDIVSLLDGDGRLLFNSAAAERISGFTVDELAGADTFEFIHPEDRPEVQRVFAHVLSTEGASGTVRYRYKHKSGGWTWMEAVAVNQLADPEVRGVVATSRDISERKRAEDEREHLLAELQEALARVKTLSGLLPICAWCKNIRDDQGYWERIETYISNHSDASFTHALCPSCERKVAPEGG
jgi:PAS domain S-box-containing protein